jgi:hypothetical protein
MFCSGATAGVIRVQISRRCLNVGMTEQRLHRCQIDPASERSGRRCVPKGVWREVFNGGTVLHGAKHLVYSLKRLSEPAPREYKITALDAGRCL